MSEAQCLSPNYFSNVANVAKEIEMANPRVDQNLRALVRGAYAVQKLRIQFGNRIVGKWKADRGMVSGVKEEETMSAKDKTILDKIDKAYKVMTDGLVKFPNEKGFIGNDMISQYSFLCMVSEYVELRAFEEVHFNRFVPLLKKYSFYTEWMQRIKGLGPRMSAVLLTEIDIYTAKYASSIRKYAGLDVGPDGTGRSRRKEHLVKVTYTDKKGKEKEKDSITYNPFLKTKLMGVLADCLIRAGNKRYYPMYLNYKNRLENHPKYGKALDGTKDENDLNINPIRRHTMAKRKIVQQFLVELFLAWKEHEGLPVPPDYAVEKLGIVHTNIDPNDIFEKIPKEERLAIKESFKDIPVDAAVFDEDAA